MIPSTIFQPDYFKGRIYLITGASSGMGAHIALTLNAMGAKVLAIARNEERLFAKQAQSTHPELFIPIIKDIAEIEGLDRWVLELAKTHGGLDGAVLAAGIQRIAPLAAPQSVESSLPLFQTNYFANLQILKALTDKRAKTKQNASFIAISSNSSIKAQKALAHYAATKGALNAAIASIALEIAPLGYRINAISPGFVDSEMTQSWGAIYDEAFRTQLAAQYPLGLGKIEDITPLVCFLLSDGARWITGQNIIIDGGASL